MKKVPYLFVMCFLGMFVNSQIIEFTDPNFKIAILSINEDSFNAKDLNGNYTTVDANSNGEIEVSEVQNISEIRFEHLNLTDMSEIHYFTNLVNLYVTDNDITSLDLSALTNLEFLECYLNDQLTSLDLSVLSNFRSLNCAFNYQLSNLNVAGLSNLDHLFITENNLTALDLTGLVNLNTLTCHNCNLSSIDLSDLVNLEYLTISQNNLTEIDFTGLNNINGIQCSENNLTSIDVSNLSNLAILDCSNNQISTITFNNNSNFAQLDCQQNLFTSIDVSMLPHLDDIDIGFNQISSIDFSNNTELRYINLENNVLESLNISNTDLQTVGVHNLIVNGNENLSNVCCDYDLVYPLMNWLIESGYPNVVISSGEACNAFDSSVIKLIFDEENDGCDENDEDLQHFTMNVNSAFQDTQYNFNETSDHIVYSRVNVATITPILNEYFTVTPSSYSIDYSTAEYDTLQFCVTPNGFHNDVEISLIPIDAAIPGFNAFYKILYKNVGTVSLSGDIQLTFENNYMSFENATQNYDALSGNLISWNYSDLAPLETRQIFVTFVMNTPTNSDFPLNSGDLLSFQALINPIATDETPFNNIATLRQEVVNSFDPNDKILIEGESISPEMVGEYVNYRIRFENTGTANAVNIVVEDTIDPTKFDISTLQVVDASNPVRTLIVNDWVRFQFFNINLPFDDANNDGYIVFKIKTLSSLQVGDTFSNQASIYFDYNSPIFTNDYMTTIEVLNVDDIESANNLSIGPNPVKDVFRINSQEDVSKVEVFDSNGRIIKSFLVAQDQYNVAELNSGVYLLKVFTENGLETLKLLKQ